LLTSKTTFLEVPLRPDYPLTIEGGGKHVTEYYAQPVGEEELYDLDKDPYELNNLADNIAYAEIKSKLHDCLFENLKKTDDPILKGPVANPKPETTLPDQWIKQKGRFCLRY